MDEADSGVRTTGTARRIVALAGRLPDAPDADARRFPAANVLRVRTRLKAILDPNETVGLICSAAAGADLLALDVAAEADLRRHVILGAEPAAFEARSVAERAGSWTDLFERLVVTPSKSMTLEILSSVPPEDDLAVNQAILTRAREAALAAGARPVAVLVWEGRSRGADDATADFRDRAIALGFDTLETPTDD